MIMKDRVARPETGRQQGRPLAMTSNRVRNVDRFIDRHGKPRHYYRRGKGARVRLPGEPGSSEFLTAYIAAANEYRRLPENDVALCGVKVLAPVFDEH